MRGFRLTIASALVIAGFLSIPSVRVDLHAAQSNQDSRVWTNQDLDELLNKVGAKGLISVVGPLPETAPAAKDRPIAQRPANTPHVREKDATWYRRQLVHLQTELDEMDVRIAELREYRSITRYMVGGVIVPQ